MAKKSRSKGKRAELEIVHLLNDFYGYHVRRGDCFRHEPDIVGLVSVHPEVKMCEQTSISQWMAQAIYASQKYKDGLPVVIHRRSREDWLCTMRIEDYRNMRGDIEISCKLDNRASFDIYKVMKEIREDVLYYNRLAGDLATMTFETWIDLYGAWALPFTE